MFLEQRHQFTSGDRYEVPFVHYFGGGRERKGEEKGKCFLFFLTIFLQEYTNFTSFLKETLSLQKKEKNQENQEENDDILGIPSPSPFRSPSPSLPPSPTPSCTPPSFEMTSLISSPSSPWELLQTLFQLSSDYGFFFFFFFLI